MLSELLAHRGAEVVLAVRDVAKGRAAAAAIAGRRPGTGPRLDVRRLDVSDPASVRAFVAALPGEVDALVANAGVMATPFRLTELGADLQMTTNHLGHHLLACLLLPRLRDRVVVVSSQAHRRAEPDFDDLAWSRRRYRPMAAYACSKLANLLFLAELQRRLTADGSTLRVLGAHPGTTRTDITQAGGEGALRHLGRIGHPLAGMPVWRGALPLAVATTHDLPGNSYLGPDGPGEMLGWPVPVGRSALAGDAALARRCWEVSEELTGVGLSRS